MRNQLKTLYSALLIVSVLGLTSTVHGVPAFARQTGLECTSCHAAPGFPVLNSFGQAFKAGGYTQANEDNLIGDGESLSIPTVLNMSVVGKIRNTTEDGVNVTDIPDEAGFFLGGRVGKNIGYAIEVGGGEWIQFKLIFAPEIGPLRLGIVPWWSDAGGPAWAFEAMSTGAVSNIRIAEDATLVSANMALMKSALEQNNGGIGLYLWHPMFFVVGSAFNHDFGPDLDWAANNGPDWYGRAVFTPMIGDMQLGVGVQFFDYNDESTLSADVQALSIAGLPLSAMLTFSTNLTSSTTALNIAVDYGIIENVLNATLAARIRLSADMTTQVGLSVRWSIVKNVKLMLEGHYDLGASSYALREMLFFAF
jgi:hypothetical protein